MMYNKKQQKAVSHNILPEEMTMSYVEFVSQQRNQKLAPVKQEIRELEEKEVKLCELFREANGDANKLPRILQALQVVREELGGKERFLNKLDLENPVDLELLSIARELDGLEAHNRAAKLYCEISKQIADIVPILNKTEGAVKAAGESTPLGLVQLMHILPEISRNIRHDVQYGLSMRSAHSLRVKLDARLTQLQKTQAWGGKIDEVLSKLSATTPSK